MKKGDYVLATKFSDGDPADQFAVGFYDRFDGGRHFVVDSNGTQMRANGFRRAEPVAREVGAEIVRSAQDLESRALAGEEISLWSMVTDGEIAH